MILLSSVHKISFGLSLARATVTLGGGGAEAEAPPEDDTDLGRGAACTNREPKVKHDNKPRTDNLNMTVRTHDSCCKSKCLTGLL
jgi:hypothetical protein